MTAESDFTKRLVEAAPELEPLLAEHLGEQEGELLAYVLMADVARWLTDNCTSDPDRVGQIFAWLEAEFATGTFDVRNLIDVGIVEMLPAAPEGSPVLDRLGPTLRSRAEIAGLLDACCAPVRPVAGVGVLVIRVEVVVDVEHDA